MLLLHSLVKRINLQLQRYKLVPYGNYSYIKVLADEKDLPLYGSGGFRLIWDNKFDAGGAQIWKYIMEDVVQFNFVFQEWLHS